MTGRTQTRSQLPLASVLLIVALGTSAIAEPGNDERENADLCRRVFEAIDKPAITFGLQGHAVRPSAHAALDRIIQFTRNCPDGTIVIVGHSDSIGDESFNLAISRQRAQAVADYLLQGGVRADRLQVVGRGSSQPVADNATRNGRAQNRRIELKLETPVDDT